MTKNKSLYQILDDYIPDSLLLDMKEEILQSLLSLIPKEREWDTSEPYDNPDIAQGHNEAVDELRIAIKEWVEGK